MFDEQVRSDNSTLSATVTAASRAADRWAQPASHHDWTAPEAELVSSSDPRYPRMLRLIENPPQHLYIRGSLGHKGDDKALAIVGSRNATTDGVRAAESIAGHLASLGHTVVSGLAAGIDSAAHRGALAVNGRTVAVVGTGTDRIYPASNAGLQDRIAQHGAVISQFAPGQPPSKTTFPARNVLIAGLARASLLVELAERSGTRIAATITREQDKPVLLWEPLLGHQPWARSFAAEPRVYFVGSAKSVAQALEADMAAK
ncbi:DNA-processing protein DprA [Tomitella gaofuii]|uniref:DNA-processing protein DprA n=1 Tax=Tomitella gaofuii TaxID=2760083 RepID=UPI0015FCABB4|nr:DNA-processing protein DprA [Tomitella gaofuii]